jgi:hypothetical protein
MFGVHLSLPDFDAKIERGERRDERTPGQAELL